MNTNRKLAVVTALASIAATALGSASASADGDTTVSFTISGGNLSIAASGDDGDAADGTADAATDLGSSTLSIGSNHVYGPTAVDGVVVTDLTNLVGTWCVTAELEDSAGANGFKSAGGDTIAGSTASLIAVATTTSGVMTPSVSVARSMGSGAVDLAGGVTALGGGSVTIVPTITVTVPPATASGTYSGTLIYTADSSLCTLT